MDSKILLGKILQRFKDNKIARVEGYFEFGYIRETEKTVYVTREKGKDTPIPFKKILEGIEVYKSNPELYNSNPTSLRAYNLKFTTSPIFALLHLLNENDYHKKQKSN
jgi:hypothetical protein